jgi:hypothetical protein
MKDFLTAIVDQLGDDLSLGIGSPLPKSPRETQRPSSGMHQKIY